MRVAMQMFAESRGAALLTVLLFTVLMFILVSAMLISAGKEVLIAGLHRDAIRAEEHAQAGLADLARRIEAGRAWRPDAVDAGARCTQDGGIAGVRVSLPGADACLSAITRAAGPSGAFHELRSEAAVGRGRRRFSAVVQARTATAWPGVLVLESLTEDPGIEVASGEVHVQTHARYLTPANADRTTYAGWRIEQTALVPGDGVDACYTHAECLARGRPQWWPGHRRAAPATQPFRAASLPGNPTPDPRVPGAVLAFTCPAGPPPAQAGQTVGSNGPGFQATDLRADLNPADLRQVAIAAEPLYGCTVDGLPYTWVREAFDTEDDVDTEPDRFLWFTAVRFDQWLARYGCFDERALTWVPCNGFHPDPLQGDPGLGAVLPPIPAALWRQNHDQRKSGGGPVTPAEVALGRCTDPPVCRSPANDRRMVVLAAGDYTLICPGSCPDGHGVLVVDGDLHITGAFTYRGTIVVRGALVLDSGTATFHGPVSAGRLVNLGGTLRVLAGTPVATGTAGPAALSRRAWWER